LFEIVWSFIQLVITELDPLESQIVSLNWPIFFSSQW